MLKTASDIAGGLMIFRDTFCQYGLGTPLLQAIPIALFGKKVVRHAQSFQKYLT